MNSPFARIRTYHAQSAWRFDGPALTLACLSQSLSDPFADAEFLKAAWDARDRDDPFDLPTPPGGEMSGPYFLRTRPGDAARAEVTANRLARLCWLYYPELVGPGEFARNKLKANQVDGLGFRWTIRPDGDTLLLGLTVIPPAGGEPYRLAPCPADDALAAVGGNSVFRAIQDLLG